MQEFKFARSISVSAPHHLLNIRVSDCRFSDVILILISNPITAQNCKYISDLFNTKFTKMAKGKSLTKEEELLLQDFSRDVSKKSSLLFYGNAVLVSILPLCMFDVSSHN